MTSFSVCIMNSLETYSSIVRYFLSYLVLFKMHVRHLHSMPSKVDAHIAGIIYPPFCKGRDPELTVLLYGINFAKLGKNPRHGCSLTLKNIQDTSVPYEQSLLEQAELIGVPVPAHSHPKQTRQSGCFHAESTQKQIEWQSKQLPLEVEQRIQK